MRKDLGLSFAGETSINEVSIVTAKGFIQTVTNQVAGIEIFEDIFAPFITGIIYMKESHDLLNLFPLIGEEFVRIELQTPGLEEDSLYKGEFYITKMTDQFKFSERESGYLLHFVSKEAIIDMNKKISKTYFGKVSESVKNIVTSLDGLETTKTLNIEDTLNSTKHISQFWSPLKNINYLVQQAMNKDTSPSYVFFENTNGLNFVSIDTLVTVPAYQQFTWDNYNQDYRDAGGTARNMDKDYQRIIEIVKPEAFDYVDRITSGMYGSRLISYDLVTKKYTDKNYIARDFIGKEKHLNRYSIVSPTSISKPNSLIINEHKYYGNFNSYGDVTNTMFLQRRVSMMQQYEANKLRITVLGRTDYCVGQVVNLRLFKNQEIQTSEDPEELIDKIYSGNYLIAALNHVVDREKHMCTMELIKDSFIRQV